MKKSEWQEVAHAKKKSQRMEGTQESFWEIHCLIAEKIPILKGRRACI